jgi:hypothetical protein
LTVGDDDGLAAPRGSLAKVAVHGLVEGNDVLVGVEELAASAGGCGKS